MSAIERCRTAALGGHVEQCDACGHQRIAFNSCRDRHCPKCQSLTRAQWLEDRRAELLPVEYFHVVFTLPQEIAAIAYQNKAEVYGLLVWHREVLAVEPIAIMLRKGDPAFKKAVDDSLMAMMKSGEMARIHDRWFIEPIPPLNKALDSMRSSKSPKTRPNFSGNGRLAASLRHWSRL